MDVADMPILRFEVERMKSSIAHMLGLHGSELGEYIEAQIGEAIEAYPWEANVQKIINEEITKRASDYFKYGRGAQVIQKGIELGFEALSDPVSDIDKARSLIEQYGGIDGSHHKQWVLDQVIRCLVPDYDAWAAEMRAGHDGPETYDWDEGTPP